MEKTLKSTLELLGAKISHSEGVTSVDFPNGSFYKIDKDCVTIFNLYYDSIFLTSINNEVFYNLSWNLKSIHSFIGIEGFNNNNILLDSSNNKKIPLFEYKIQVSALKNETKKEKNFIAMSYFSIIRFIKFEISRLNSNNKELLFSTKK